jgi:hypothetical protein
VTDDSLTRTPVRAEAVTPPGKVSWATLQTSTPPSTVPLAVSEAGSRNGLPAAAPAMARAYETG